MKKTPYFAYLLRIWFVGSKQTGSWLASLESPHSGERVHFASLDRLFAFLTDQCTGNSAEGERHELGRREE